MPEILKILENPIKPKTVNRHYMSYEKLKEKYSLDANIVIKT